MKIKSTICALSFGLLLSAQNAAALPVTIADAYYGGTPTSAAYLNQDIVGSASYFDISHMVVDVSGGILTVKINTSYFDNVGLLKTEFGDLFISSNGWSPFGSGPFISDDHSNGEAWEYAIKLDNHGEAYSGNNSGTSMIGQSGSASLHQILDDSEIELSNHPTGAFRAGQEVQFNPNQNNLALANGSWSIGALDQGYSDLIISISLLGTGLEFVDTFGFHFAFTCGNDVIEGVYHTQEVPEPASMALLGTACGLFGIKRRRKAKKDQAVA
jgi:hypothetical protein